MINLRRLPNAIRSRINFRKNWNRKTVIVPGFPEGLEFDLLNKVCLDVLAEPLHNVSYAHLSGWKPSGAFRVFLETRGNKHWTLIYKNAVYDSNHIPAISELPIRPGPPEYLVYSNCGGNLSKYLPRVYHFHEVQPNRHYQYLIEDLRNDYKVIRSLNDFLAAAEELPAIHDAISDWFKTVQADNLLSFDNKFFSALSVYINANLPPYLKQIRNGVSSAIMNALPEVIKFYESQEFYRTVKLGPIHGDYNFTNILIDQESSTKFKIIDWEWTGVGIQHADLASLLKPIKAEEEERAVRLFLKNKTELPIEAHLHLYHYCKLERGLFDAAFFAKQFFESENVSQINIHKHIQAALARASVAYNRLAFK